MSRADFVSLSHFFLFLIIESVCVCVKKKRGGGGWGVPSEDRHRQAGQKIPGTHR